MVLTYNHNQRFEQKQEKISFFFFQLKISIFAFEKNLCILHGYVFIMYTVLCVPDGEGISDGVGVSTNDVAPIDGAWSTWNAWVSGNCPVTCCMGNPLQSRLRRCDSPAPAGTGADCPGLHYALRTAPDSERCGSMDNQCPSRYFSLCVRKPTMRVPTRSDTNRAVQSQNIVRGWKFWI